MFLEGTILGLIIGKIRGGKFLNLGQLSIRAWPLIILAFLIQITPAFSKQIIWLEKINPYVFLISFAMLALCLLMNTNKKGMKLILLGVLLNLLVIMFNNYKMPISFESLDLAGMSPMVEGIEQGLISNYTSLDTVANWTKYFSKYIVIPKPYPLSKVLSVGDILATLGLIIFIQGEMLRNRYNFRNRMIKFDYRGKI